MTTDTPQIVADIRKTMEKATKGPWHPGCIVDDNHPCNCRTILDEGYASGIATIVLGNDLPLGEGGIDGPGFDEAKANCAYIAACNPENMAAFLDAFEAERERADKAEAELKALKQAISGRPPNEFDVEDLPPFLYLEMAKGLHDGCERAEAAEAEVARCHARLEIDHWFKLIDGEMVREETPQDERHSIPDAVTCRDETIKIQDEEIERMKDRLGDPDGTIAHADAIIAHAETAEAALKEAEELLRRKLPEVYPQASADEIRDFLASRTGGEDAK